jgi:5'-nucleotidase/UDP-sugar diphosphatase
MGTLIADVMCDYFAADVALIPGGKIRGNKSYTTGLTFLDINAELPFPDNNIYVTDFTGEQLHAAVLFSKTQCRGKGGFLQLNSQCKWDEAQMTLVSI